MTSKLAIGEHVDLDCGVEVTRRDEDDPVFRLRSLSTDDSVLLERDDVKTLAKLAGYDLSEPSEMYVANSPVAWGSGDHETDALETLAGHLTGGRIDGSLDVSIARVTGFNGIRRTPSRASVDADELHSVSHYDIPKHELMSLNSAITDLEIMAERILVENEVDEEDSDE